MPSIAFVLLALVGLVALLVLYGLFVLAGNMAAWLLRACSRGKQITPRQNVRARRLGYFSLFIIAAYNTYAAIYPSDDFYFSEFKEVALREAPSSARIVAKSATYPDLHGDYCSFSRIEVSKEDFNSLLKAISEDKLFSEGESITIGKTASLPEFGSIASFTRQEPGEEDHHLGLRFLSSRKHIEVNLCVT